MSNQPQGAAERELEVLAVLDRFACELESGAAPRLSAYLEAYPQFAAELTAFATDYLGAAGAAGEREADAERAAGELSAGSRRALASLFPASAPVDDLIANTGRRGFTSARDAGRLKAIAERKEPYATERRGLLALAQQRDISLERLAAALDLPVAVVKWLDAQQARDVQDAVIVLLAEALGTEPDAVVNALARDDEHQTGMAPGTPIEAALLAHPALTSEQRQRWAERLLSEHKGEHTKGEHTEEGEAP